jgi:uncharacterized repeat protein (TIGR01451 family)
MTVNDSTPNEGDTIVYKVTLQNLGPSKATRISIVDALPLGLEHVSSRPNRGSYSPQSGTWSISSLPKNDSAFLVIKAKVGAGTAGTTILNEVNIAGAAQADPVSGNNTFRLGVRVFGADLALAKSVDDATPFEGDDVVFTVRLENYGPDAATDATVNELLPPGLALVGAAASQGNYESSSGNWSVGALGVAESATLTVTARVETDTDGLTIPNTATITSADPADPKPDNNTGSASVSVQSQPVDLAVVKSVDDTRPAEGANVAYTVVLSNAGPGGATGVELTDELPQGVTYASNTSSQGTYDEESGVWTVGDVSASANATLTIHATVDNGTSGSTIVNEASVTALDQTDTNAANDFASAAITVDIFTPGERLITTDGVGDDQRPAWAPDGSAIAFDSDRTPGANRDIFQIAATGGPVSQLTTSTAIDQHPDWSPSGTQIVYSAGSPPDIVATSSGGGGTPVPLYEDPLGTIDQFPHYSRDGSTVAFAKANDIYLVPSTGGTPTPLETHAAIDQHPTWSADGTKIAFLSNRAGTNDIWVVPSAGGAATPLTTDPGNEGAPDWSPDGAWIAFHSNKSGNFDIWMIPAEGGTPVPVTTGPQSDNQPDWSNSGENIAFSRDGDIWVYTFPPQGTIDLIVSVGADDLLPAEQSAVRYTVTVANLGKVPATGIVVSEALPQGLSYSRHTVAEGDYSVDTGVWKVGTLDPMECATLTISTNVDQGTSGRTIVNTASLSHLDQDDVFSGNDVGSAELLVQGVASGRALTGATPLPATYHLSIARPNPFHDRTALHFELPRSGPTSLTVWDVAGRLVRTVQRGHAEPGPYAPVWDGRDELGRTVAAGVYFVRLESGDFEATRRVVRLQ